MNDNNEVKSFTLIEVLMVIIIIGILASLILFSTQDAYDKKSKLDILNLVEGIKAKNLNSLVAEWKFDGPTPAGSIATNNDVRDSWGYKNGNVTGHAPMVKEGDDCVSGKCLWFEGDTNSYYIEFGGVMDSFVSVSVSAWIKPVDTVGRNVFNSLPLILHYRGAGFYLRDSNGGTCGYLGWSPAPIANEWNYVVATWSNSLIGDGKMRLYIDGKKQSTELSCTGGVSGKLRTGGVNIGKYFNSSQIQYKGYIDDIRIYDSAISVSEIKQNYVAGLNSMLQSGAISKEEYNQKTLNLAKND